MSRFESIYVPGSTKIFRLGRRTRTSVLFTITQRFFILTVLKFQQFNFNVGYLFLKNSIF